MNCNNESRSVPLNTQRNSKTNCCVVGCTNAYYNTSGNVKFYSFPGKWYEKERKKIWVESVRRVCSENKKSPWQPKPHDRICSMHFVGNKKSDHPQNPAYNPTIFPKVYMKSSTCDANAQQQRFQRLQNRLIPLGSSQTSTSHQNVNINEVVEESMEVEESKEDFSCQTNCSDFFTDDLFVFEVNFFSGFCEVSTQCQIPSCQNINLLQNQKDKCVGNDEVRECKGFHGHNSVRNDAELSCLAGVYFDRFALLLSFLTVAHKNCKLTAENRLLLFLMKIKLGLSFSVLGVLFQLHPTTCHRLFVDVLGELVQKTKNFVFWPSREVIDRTMPKAFRKHFPKCRAVIDCTEIKIQQPKKVDQRILTYSQYKSSFTAKFLVAISPTGFISFVSKCYGGRSTDAHITNDSGFLSLLEPNDVILADKGFPGIKCTEDVVLVLPPFVHDGRLSYEEVEETYTIASVRIHVERSIQRIKVYNILNKIPYNLFQSLDDIVYMCCVLTNLQPPTIDLEDDN